MSLFSTRNTNRTIVLLALTIFVVLFLAAPVPSPIQKLVPSVGPHYAWAGSPDETLAPPPNPKQRSAAFQRPATGNTRSTISGRTLFEILLRAYWSTIRL
jgi:hypothetical protein